jgi:outer membrane receptor protein involved in Fe transport
MNAKVWEVVYLSDVQTLLIDLQASYPITDRSAVTMTAGFNSTTQKDSSRSMPYIPVFTSGILYQLTFINGITAEGTIEYVSGRYTDFQHRHSAPAYLLLGAKGEYEFIQNLRGIVQCTNLLNQNYVIWDGYRERTLFVSFGLTYKW